MTSPPVTPIRPAEPRTDETQDATGSPYPSGTVSLIVIVPAGTSNTTSVPVPPVLKPAPLETVNSALMGGAVQEWSGSARFPLGTLVVNLIGCFVIGLLSYLADSREFFSTEARAFLFVGLLGGFTTFSAFGSETVSLFREGDNTFALINVAVQVIVGLLLVWAGRAAAQVVWG